VSVDDVSLRDSGCDPEQEARYHELLDMARRMLASMDPREREIISRSYLQGQSTAHVRNAMGLSEIQRRNLQHHALGILRQRTQRAAYRTRSESMGRRL
jgi:DNA-directed RNA polymerase specialized sigma24 family protein